MRMQITRIRAYRVELPLHEGSYKWSGGKSVKVFDSTVVEVETDAGVSGFGEVCPLGPFYLPAYARGVRAGLAELARRIVERASDGFHASSSPASRSASSSAIRAAISSPRAGPSSTSVRLCLVRLIRWSVIRPCGKL